MGVCSERVIPNVWCGANFVEAHMKIYSHFSWQAQYFARALRRGSAILVAGAGNREVARCDGGDISWQAQCFVCVRRVDVERFVAGAGNREVVSCGIHWDWRVSGCCLEGLESRICLAGLRDVCAPMGVSA